MADKRILDKIRKLLTLAAKTGNSHEAASALSKAQALMAKHQVDEAEVVLSDIGRYSSVLDQMKPPQWVVNLAQVIRSAFGCDIVLGQQWRGIDIVRTVDFFGIEPNPELAKYCFDVLYRQLRKARTDYIKVNCKRCKSTTKTARGDAFAESWTMAVYDKITALVLTPETKQLIERYKNEKIFRNQPAKEYEASSRAGKSSRYNDARHAGYREGRNAQLNSPVSGQETQKLTAHSPS
ncbi:DUF2786 domain-containing protein [Bowmanella dokdonensis]|uniref:DUF2786 domain-containing protein n=1 Tax=Bowmanella dokdonensis TaxID=751969 RepID=A0A939IQS9_9ALTE|nr:DUF2786 domain-containing protein [Bowmanella dokdonensis]MBN7824746.1 DUF2786 domain-containing protein [Bowmanella dokdonensis]